MRVGMCQVGGFGGDKKVGVKVLWQEGEVNAFYLVKIKYMMFRGAQGSIRVVYIGLEGRLEFWGGLGFTYF